MKQAAASSETLIEVERLHGVIFQEIKLYMFLVPPAHPHAQCNILDLITLRITDRLSRWPSGLRSLGCCDRGFGSRLGRGSLVCVFILCLCCPV
jgi:hypothetical protein